MPRVESVLVISYYRKLALNSPKGLCQRGSSVARAICHLPVALHLFPKGCESIFEGLPASHTAVTPSS